MKYIAVFLIFNVLLLAAVPGMANAKAETVSCCKKKLKDYCKHQKHNANDDCAKGNCNGMLCCPACGFIVCSPVYLSPAITDLNKQLALPFLIGEVSDYYGNGWNPPKG